jgi:hypothetical protein
MAKFYSIYPSAVILGTAIFPVVLTNLTLIPHTIYGGFDLSPKTLYCHRTC